MLTDSTPTANQKRSSLPIRVTSGLPANRDLLESYGKVARSARSGPLAEAAAMPQFSYFIATKTFGVD
jgi:hypothetical protein